MIGFSRARRRDYCRAMTPGWIVTSILFGIALLSLYEVKQRHHINFHLCLLRESTGIRCPLCGGTTATLLLASGSADDAFRQNPLVATALIVFTAWSLIWLTAGWKGYLTIHPKNSLALGLILLGLNWAYVLVYAAPT